MIRLRDRLIKGMAFNLIAVAFNQGSTLVVNVIIARILLKQTFGEYAMVQSTLLTLTVLSQLATGYTASKYIAEYRTSDPDRAGRIMGVCAIVSFIMASVGALILIVSAPWIAGSMLKSPHLTISLMIGAGFLFFSAINGYQMGALSGLEAYPGLAKAGVASGIIAVIIISLGAIWGGSNGAIFGLSLSAFLRCIIHNFWMRYERQKQHIIPQYWGSLKQEKSIVIKFAIPAAVAGYYGMPMNWLANSFLVRQPDGYSEMALYVAASNIKVLLVFIPTVISNVTFSLLNHMKGTDDRRQYNRLYIINVATTFVSTLAGALILGLFGNYLLMLFGRTFTGAKNILLIVLIACVLEMTSQAVYQRIQTYGVMWLSFFFINVPISVVFVTTAYALVPKLGALGLGEASLLMTVLQLLLSISLSLYLYKQDKAMASD